MAPVYLEMKRRGKLEPVLLSTGQHTDLLAHGLQPFQIKPDIALNTMRPGQPLHQLVGSLFQQVGDSIQRLKPSHILVQGDTVSASTGAWCGFYQRIPVVHIEAGLRTGDLGHPFPEEATRRGISVVAKAHMAPTREAKENLLKEAVDPKSIFVTGNTTIDALYVVRDKTSRDTVAVPKNGRRILVTGHRRENFGEGLANLCRALLDLSTAFPDLKITYAVHPNPSVRGPVEQMLGSRKNVYLIPPQDYEEFVRLMGLSDFIISDSGGVQEEAPALGKPVLITRTTTERPEAVACGANRLVGTDVSTIVNAATELLTHPGLYQKMATAGCPYGDGHAAERICDYLEGKPVEDFDNKLELSRT